MPRRLAIAGRCAYNPAMRADLRKLLELVLARHRNPWNFTVQALCLPLLAFGLWLHSAALLALAILGLAASLFAFGMPDMSGTGLAPLVPLIERALAAEQRWRDRPAGRKRQLRTALLALGLLFLAFILWTNDLPLLALTIGGIALYRVMRQNKADGIDP